LCSVERITLEGRRGLPKFCPQFLPGLLLTSLWGRERTGSLLVYSRPFVVYLLPDGQRVGAPALKVSLP
jgi:hypothetical protein